MPTFDPAELQGQEGYFLLTSLVVPRPIAWVATRAVDGTHNLAPHSFFNVISSQPPIVHFTVSGRVLPPDSPDGTSVRREYSEKDTLANVRATGEFTISIVSNALIEQMNLTAADFPPNVDEFEWAGIEKAPSETVDVPRVAASPAALECKVRTILSMGTGTMVFGDVTRFYVADHVWDGGRVDITSLDPVGRLSGSQYFTSGTISRLPRPSWADLKPR